MVSVAPENGNLHVQLSVDRVLEAGDGGYTV